MPDAFADLIPDDPVLDQIHARESGGQNLPPQANHAYPLSHASGVDQIQPATWKAWSKGAGIGTEYAEAYQAPKTVQDAVAEWGKKQYGPNSPYTWAASAPRGGYQEPKKVAGAFDDLIPKTGKAGAFDDLVPKQAAQGMPAPANKPEQGPPQRSAGPIDPSIAARQGAPAQPQPLTGMAAAVGAEGQAMMAAPGADKARQVADYLKAHNYQLADVVGDLMSKGMDATQGTIAGILKQPFPGLLPGFGLPETQANQLARDYMTYALGKSGEIIKSPAVETADGRVVPGPNHDAIEAAGTTGKPGFVTQSGRFVDRQEGAEIARAAKQAPHLKTLNQTPEEIEAEKENQVRDLTERLMKETATKPVDLRWTPELHSEDLRPASAGAMATDKAILDAYKAVPPVPSAAIIKSIEDGGQRLRGAATNDKATWQQFVDKLPPELKDAGLQERFNKFVENGTKFGDTAILSLPEQELFKKFAKPIAEENRDLFGELKKSGNLGRNPDGSDPLDVLDPEYAHRPRKGMTKEFDAWMGDAGQANPMGGFRSRTAPAAQDRVYYVMENGKGERKLLAKTDHGMMILNKGQPAQPLPRYQGEATGVHDKFKIGGEQWTVKHARTEEIERETGIEYYKNFMANAIKSNVQLKAAVRALNEVNRIKQTPEFQAYTLSLDKNRPPGYTTTNFPPFRDRWMDPLFAAAIDSFWSAPKMALGQKIAAINRYALQSLFWSPLVHPTNVASHWFVSRGFDWLNPAAYKRLALTFPEAVVEVVTQGEKYKEMLRDGSGLVYGSIANEAFHRTMLKGLGEDIKRQPWKWDPIARVIGVGPSDLYKAIMNASSRVMWATSDAFMMQRVLELRMKGMGKLASIEEAEKHIPNYRIPSQVLGQPGIASALKDPSLFAFSRYDYGVFKSYAHMAKDLVKGTPEQKLAAVGNIMALGFLTYYVWPYISQALQKITGDKDLEFGPRGALKGPMLLRDLASGGKGLGDIIPSLITIAPIPNMIVQGLSGFRDHFGRNIVEPGDWQAKRWGRVGAQAGEEVAQDLNPIYAEASQGMEDRKTGGLRGAGERVLRQGLGIRKTPQPYKGRTSGGTAEQQANYRRTHPRGPIEQLEKGAEQWLKSND